MTTLSIVAGFLTALIAALVTYIVAARRMSGKIATSDASDLWEESKSIRQDYRDRIDAMAQRCARLEERIADLDRRNLDLERENFECRSKIQELEANARELRETIAAMRTVIDAQKEELKE